MGANRKGRLLVVAAVLLVAAGTVGCKKGSEDRRKTEAAAGSSSGGESAGSPTEASGADPHAGMDMSGGGGDDPHAGMDMSGGGASGGGDPHAGMSMGGGEKTPVQMDGGKAVVGPLLLAVPKGWTNQPAGGMRKAQWEIPGAKGAAAASLVVFYFGSGGAGGVEENLARWHDQFQPEGGATAVAPKTEKRTVGSMAVTTTEVEGRYVASMSPGSSEKNDEAGWMLLGAILETPMGPYYFKLTGPKATVGAARKDFRALIDTAQLKK